MTARDGGGIAAPLKLALFRRIWLASLLSNLGLLIMGVGAAWSMTELTASADMVALVQTALMLPVMLISLGAGAAADMYDRRIVGLVAIGVSFAGAAGLSTLALFGAVSPPLLLLFCFVIGSGMALFGPAWQASVSEQVPSQALPAAIALNSISYNIARSFGPAIGGLIVAASGAVAAFIMNALLYLPLIAVFYTWRRAQEPPRLPPERIVRAIISGLRYVLHSPPIRITLTRCFVTALAGGSVSALMPLVARTLLGGGAQLYGVMLGVFGMGAVLGALNISLLRQHLSGEHILRFSVAAMGVGVMVAGISRSPFLTAPALMLAGAGWMVSITTFNVAIQMSVPRWVAGRSLAAFQAAVAGGLASGSWMWGHFAQSFGIDAALIASGGMLLVSPLLGLWLRLAEHDGSPTDALDRPADPEVNLAITARSGPIVIEIDYRIDPARAREFYGEMQKVQFVRQRNGAYEWSLGRDIADPEVWTERYHCPTWLDYLRLRTRSTEPERAMERAAMAFHLGPEPVRIRRRLDRPWGSVRWKDDTPDPSTMPGFPA